MRRPPARSVTALSALLTLVVLAGCGSNGSTGQAGAKVAIPATPTEPPAPTLRLGYFANVTHATPIVGVAKGLYQKALGGTKLQTQIFNAGPAAIEALFAGSLDAAYLGPNPAINGYAKSGGAALRIIAGTTSGGAQLVVRPQITSAAELKGKTLATPQLGNTQDVALRSWLAGKGLRTSTTGGDVTIAPQDNATTLTLFKSGKIDGAWVPEPWASRLVIEGRGRELVDERSLWPGGRFVVTNLVVSTKYLQAHPATVKALLTGQVDTTAYVKTHLADAKTTVQAEVGRITGKPFKNEVNDRAFAAIEPTDDPVASSLATSAKNAEQVGLLKPVNLKGIYDLRLLNQALAAKGDPPVADAGPGA